MEAEELEELEEECRRMRQALIQIRTGMNDIIGHMDAIEKRLSDLNSEKQAE